MTKQANKEANKELHSLKEVNNMISPLKDPVCRI